MKGKERVPVPVAGPAFGSGVKFVMFYVLGGFLQPASEIASIQSALSPVCDPCLRLQQQKLKVRDGFFVNSQELHFAGECVGKLSDLKLEVLFFLLKSFGYRLLIFIIFSLLLSWFGMCSV